MLRLTATILTIVLLQITNSPEQAVNLNPTLSDDEALRQIVNHLQESEAWTIENPGLLTPGAGGGARRRARPVPA